MLRSSTLQTLLKFHNALPPQQSTLGQALRASLEADPVKPVLLRGHYEAVDRRVAIVLRIVRECLQGNLHNPSEVIFSHDDLYNSGYDAVENDKAFN